MVNLVKREAKGLTVRHPAVMTVLAVTQVTFTGCEGLAGAAVHRAADGLQSKDTVR